MTVEEKEKAKKLLGQLKQAGRQNKDEYQRLKHELAATLMLVDPKSKGEK